MSDVRHEFEFIDDGGRARFKIKRTVFNHPPVEFDFVLPDSEIIKLASYVNKVVAQRSVERGQSWRDREPML